MIKHNFFKVHRSFWYIILISLFRGLASGLGWVLGATILVSLLTYFLSQIEFIPILGELVSKLIEEIEGFDRWFFFIYQYTIKMSFFIFKIIFTSLLIVIITEISKFNVKIGSILTAMPITTLLVIFWLYFEKVQNNEISEYTKNTLYFILPTIPFFIIFPFLISRCGFLISVSLSLLITVILVIYQLCSEII